MKLKLFTILITILTVTTFFITPIHAQNTLCDVFPCDDTANPDISIGGLVTFLTELIFIGFIGFGIVLIIKGAVKILKSEGDEGKIQEGAQAIKGAMIGLALVFLGIIGLVIVAAIFNSEALFGTDVEEPGGVEIDRLL